MLLRVLVFSVFCMLAFDTSAQMLQFDTQASKKNVVKIPKNVSADIQRASASETKDGPTLEELTKQSSSNVDMSRMLSAPRKNSNNIKDENVGDEVEQDEEDVFIPEDELYRLNTPTMDGSQRGGQALVEVDENGRMKKAANIFFFYDNFKITDFIKGTGTCDVRFNILSNLDRKISQIDVKLVWPGLTTTLSFSNIDPNTQTYYNYSLIGEGCYKMDMAPNIIVNRCRVKGMTATECAGKIVWLSK